MRVAIERIDKFAAGYIAVTGSSCCYAGHSHALMLGATAVAVTTEGS